MLSVAVAAALRAERASPIGPVLISYAVGALLGADVSRIAAARFRRRLSLAIDSPPPFSRGHPALFRAGKAGAVAALPPGAMRSARPAAEPQHDHGRSGTMILIGDTFHNFVDGVLIAAALKTRKPNVRLIKPGRNA